MKFEFKKPAITTLAIFSVVGIAYLFFENIEAVLSAAPLVVFQGMVWGACLVVVFCTATLYFNRDKKGVRYKLLPTVGNVFGVSLVVAMVSIVITLFKSIATPEDTGPLHMMAMLFFILVPSVMFMSISREIESTNP